MNHFEEPCSYALRASVGRPRFIGCAEWHRATVVPGLCEDLDFFGKPKQGCGEPKKIGLDLGREMPFPRAVFALRLRRAGLIRELRRGLSPGIKGLAARRIFLRHLECRFH